MTYFRDSTNPTYQEDSLHIKKNNLAEQALNDLIVC